MESTKIPHSKSFITNIPFFISGCAFAALQAISFKRSLAAMILILVLFIASFFLKAVSSFRKENTSRLSISLTICSLALSAFTFYNATIYNSRFKTIAASIGIPINLLVFFITLLLGIASFIFVNTVWSFALLYLCSPGHDSIEDTYPKTYTSKFQIIVIIATAFATITICSKSSPLYPFNDWGDANCFMTIGKSMLHGKVPYRDLFDHKGPLLYMLHALAALVDETSFLGIYFLEVIACAFYLFFGYKTMRLYRKSTSIFLIPVLAAVVYSATCFCHGDSTEELCLPILSYAIYVGLKAIQSKDLPTKFECLMIGVSSACVLWIKYTMLGFYLGWICVPAFLLLRTGNLKKLLKKILFIIIGVLITTLPILCYFWANHALLDLWTVYFYDNLFYYTVSANDSALSSAIYNLQSGIKSIRVFNFIPAVLAGLGGLSLLKKWEKRDFLFILTSAIGLFLLVYIGGRSFKYYPLIFSAFTPIGVVATVETLKNFCKKHSFHFNFKLLKYGNTLLCFGSALFAFIMCDNTYLLQYSKSDLPQYQFAEIISQVENATLLNAGTLDGGFYTTTGIVPNCKYFCGLNIPLPEIMETQNEFISQGMVDFVITRDAELDSKLYECVATATFYYEESYVDYYLYQITK